MTYVCMDMVTKTPVDMDLCDEMKRPFRTQKECGDIDCDNADSRARAQTR